MDNNVEVPKSTEYVGPERIILSPPDEVKKSQPTVEEELKILVPYPSRLRPKRNSSNVEKIKEIFNQMR
ncbi:hypothetical protein, partial [Alteromonas stellipolaris]|uniref:hypothetical protein n=1 Tax=Alteromonas stellipolaris TaxID=233316 RepID=UPI001DAF413C